MQRELEAWEEAGCEGAAWRIATVHGVLKVSHTNCSVADQTTVVQCRVLPNVEMTSSTRLLSTIAISLPIFLLPYNATPTVSIRTAPEFPPNTACFPAECSQYPGTKYPSLLYISTGLRSHPWSELADLKWRCSEEVGDHGFPNPRQLVQSGCSRVW